MDAASEQNRIQKMLEGGNIKISGTISSIIGKSGLHSSPASSMEKPSQLMTSGE